MVHTVAGREVGDIGYGLMGLTWTRSTPLADADAFAAMKAALDAGCNYWNGGEFYGTPENNSLTLLRKYFARYPEDADRVVLNVKGCSFEGFRRDASAEGIGKSLGNCLRMLGEPGRIDQFEPARKDDKVDIEVTMRAFADHVARGDIKEASLSEVSAQTIRRAAKVGKVGSVEVELSLWNTEPLTNGIAEACAELGIPLLAYSPLGRGILTGQIKTFDDIAAHDYRLMLPRFQRENFASNVKLVGEVEKLAARKGCTPAQIAINWLLALSRRPGMPTIIPIPGASSPERVRENAARVELTDDDLAEIERILAEFPVTGERYHPAGMAMLDQS